MSGEQALFDRTLLNARGELVRCEMRLVRLPATDRRLVRVSFIDITQRKRIEADLQVAAITFESHEGMLVTDADQTILRVNRSFCEITGYEADGGGRADAAPAQVGASRTGLLPGHVGVDQCKRHLERRDLEPAQERRDLPGLDHHHRRAAQRR
jgi:PAS domain-containing protein